LSGIPLAENVTFELFLSRARRWTIERHGSGLAILWIVRLPQRKYHLRATVLMDWREVESVQ
jgi:hypothetical protein